MSIEKEMRHLYFINHDLKLKQEKIEIFKINENKNGVPVSLDHVESMSSDEMTKKVFGSLESIFAIS